VRTGGPGRSVFLKTAAGGERELACGQVLVAAGRRPVTAGLDLAAVGVQTGSRGEIVTDARQRTGLDGQILGQQAAVERGRRNFGPLLRGQA